MLNIERRVTRLETLIRQRGAKTTDRSGESPKWQPRDFMMAGSGLAMVFAALSEKVGWSTVVAGLVRLYGGK